MPNNGIKKVTVSAEVGPISSISLKNKIYASAVHTTPSTNTPSITLVLGISRIGINKISGNTIKVEAHIEP